MSKEKPNKTTSDKGFEPPKDYESTIAGSKLCGRHVRIRSGILLHGAAFFSERDGGFTVAFGADSIWMGYVRRGVLRVQLPDLGRLTVEAGEWFIGRISEMQVITRKEEDVEVLSFSMCPCVMRSVVDLCETETAEQLQCFSCVNQYVPTVISGRSSPKLSRLSEQVTIDPKAGLQGRMQREARSLEWLCELLNQPVLAEKEPHAFGCSVHDAEALRKVAAYLAENLAAEHSLAALCRRFYINEFKLKRNFKAFYGVTVFGYLRELRFQRAEQLLQEGKYSVLEVANAVGYSNPSHFAKGFQERFGLKPKAFQRMHREGAE